MLLGITYCVFQFTAKNKLTEGSIKGFVTQIHEHSGAVVTWKRELCVVRLGADRIAVRLRKKLPHVTYPQAFDFHPTAPMLAFSYFDVESPGFNAFVMSSMDGSELSQNRVHDGLVTAIKFNSNREELITAGTTTNEIVAGQAELRFSNISSLTVSRVPLRLSALALCIATSSTSELIAIGDVSGAVHVWNDRNLDVVSTWREDQTDVASAGVYSIEFTSDGTGLLVAGGHGVSIRDARSGEVRHMCGSQGECVSAIFADRDQQLVCFTDRQGLWAWNIRTGTHKKIRSYGKYDVGRLAAANEYEHLYLAVGNSIEYLAAPTLTDEP